MLLPWLLGDATGSPTASVFHDLMDRPTDVVAPDHRDGGTGLHTSYVYDDAGRLTRVRMPNGDGAADTDPRFAMFFDYDLLDRVVRQTRYQTDTSPAVPLTTHFCYDPSSNDLRTVVAPKAQAANSVCSSAIADVSQPAPVDFSTPFEG